MKSESRNAKQAAAVLTLPLGMGVNTDPGTVL
jgi:hypothetical protein